MTVSLSSPALMAETFIKDAMVVVISVVMVTSKSSGGVVVMVAPSYNPPTSVCDVVVVMS